MMSEQNKHLLWMHEGAMGSSAAIVDELRFQGRLGWPTSLKSIEAMFRCRGRNLVFDADSAEEALEALGVWDRMTGLVDAARASRSAEGVQA